jgi:osmotically inducible lipoprotein OsmB
LWDRQYKQRTSLRCAWQFNKRGVLMKTKLFAAVFAASLLGLTGCANMDRQTMGTIGGAAAGALVGDAVVGGAVGTVGGAAIGGYIGNRATDPRRR